jgi:diaminohydroxyphosphoribosylaminopyrimidine deaminase/5-amino-6-(5-phosphoribosylamino)uracil reductase
VLGEVPENARVRPCEEWTGSLEDLLDRLGSQGILQVLVEGGAHVAGSFHRAGLVDRYVMFVAPAFMGGDGARPVLAGLGGRSMDDMWRGKVTRVRQLGDDIEIVIEPSPSSRLQPEETP